MLDDLVIQEQNSPVALDTTMLEETLAHVRRELTGAENQKARLYELLEIGEYDLQTFRERMANVRDKIDSLTQKEQEVFLKIQTIRSTDRKAQIEKLSTVLSSYQDSDAAGRNSLLHSIIDIIWYDKKKKTKPMDFSTEIELKPF
jgi:chromosome segregation ATPase